MSTWEIILLALALAADAFSVGAAVGIKHRRPRQIFRLSLHFGIFQSLLFLGGAMAGRLFVSLIEDWDHWVAFLILLALGLKMIYTIYQEDREDKKESDLTRGFHMVGLSLAVSLDAMGVGVGAVAAGAPMAISTAIIGLVASLATVVAMLLAQEVDKKLGHWCEPVAGLVLILMGTKILLEGIGV